MIRYAAIGLATLLCSAAVPAFADLGHVGSVTFSMRDNHDSTYANFRGNSVVLTSRNADVNCRDIEARFANGRTWTVFRGMIRAGRRVNINLPGNVRNVRQLDFDCRPMNTWRARVDVAANMPARDLTGHRFSYGYGPRFGMDHPF